MVSNCQKKRVSERERNEKRQAYILLELSKNILRKMYVLCFMNISYKKVMSFKK